MPLEITIPGRDEGWDLVNEIFTEPTKPIKLLLEHSLISVYKWEAKWQKPYLDKADKTDEELLDYIRCMTITPNVDPDVYFQIPPGQLKKVYDYINNPMTATKITNRKKGGPASKEILTAELIYYQMFENRIPLEFEKRHFNQLLTLIEVCSIKRDPNPKKIPFNEMAQSRTALNKARRKKYHTKG